MSAVSPDTNQLKGNRMTKENVDELNAKEIALIMTTAELTATAVKTGRLTDPGSAQILFAACLARARHQLRHGRKAQKPRIPPKA
jgi:hypothetical protein